MWYINIDSFKEANGYTIDGIWYPRVTSIVSIKAKPALYMFYAGLPDYKTGEAIKSKSAEEGTLLHETVEAILRKEPIVIPDQVKPAVNAFMDFYNNNELIAHKIEERVISKKHHFAGTMDVLAELNGVLVKTQNPAGERREGLVFRQGFYVSRGLHTVITVNRHRCFDVQHTQNAI